MLLIGPMCCMQTCPKMKQWYFFLSTYSSQLVFWFNCSCFHRFRMANIMTCAELSLQCFLLIVFLFRRFAKIYENINSFTPNMEDLRSDLEIFRITFLKKSWRMGLFKKGLFSGNDVTPYMHCLLIYVTAQIETHDLKSCKQLTEGFNHRVQKA